MIVVCLQTWSESVLSVSYLIIIEPASVSLTFLHVAGYKFIIFFEQWNVKRGLFK